MGMAQIKLVKLNALCSFLPESDNKKHNFNHKILESHRASAISSCGCKIRFLLLEHEKSRMVLTEYIYHEFRQVK